MGILSEGYNHFLDIDNLSLSTLRDILSAAENLKSLPYRDILHHKLLVAIFDKPSTRTRTSFTAAMHQLGGGILCMSSDDMQLGRGESIADTARVLSRYADLVMLRTDEHVKLQELADYSDIPVINGLTDSTHPCQIMADVMSLSERWGDLSGRVVVWSGDGNNMAVSWVHAAVKFGFTLHLACPDGLQPPSDVLAWAVQQGGDIKSFASAQEAVLNGDCIVTDTWVSMGDEQDSKENRFRHNQLLSYQVNSELMGLANSGAFFMHCLPAHRGEEVTDEVIDSSQSLVWDEAENRLHVQKAIIVWCLDMLDEL